MGFAGYAATHPGEVIAYGGSELWRRTNANFGWDDPVLEALSVALGPFGAAKGAVRGGINGIVQGFWHCGLLCASGEAMGGALGGGWNGLVEGRVQAFFDPRNSWGTYGGARCLYDNPVGAPACIAALIAAH